jgi:hypothetical protein
MLSEPQSSLAMWALIAGVALAILYFAADLRSAFRSADEREHAAAAATIGQLLTTGWIIAGLVTALGVWRGHLWLAVGAACVFWLFTAGATRFSGASRLRAQGWAGRGTRIHR